MVSKFIWLNGELLDYEKANIHLMTSALHYGAAVFEGLRCYRTDRGPAVFRLTEHSRRLIASAEVLGFRDLPYTVQDVDRAILDTVRANGLPECYIRPLLYLDGPVWSLSIDSGKPALMIAVWAWDNYLGETALSEGVRANISSFTRHHPNVMMTKAKIAGNYVNSILAKTESLRLGFEEAIMLDPQGYVAECTGENLFLVKDGKIITSSLAPVLEGITRHTLMTIASGMGYEVLEQLISRDQLYTAEEVFVCGTAAEVAGLREIDHRRIGSEGVGPVTLRLQEAYRDAVRGRLEQYAAWCTYVEADNATR